MASAVVEQSVTPSKVPLPEDEDSSEDHVAQTSACLLDKGKRHLAEGDIPSAVNALQDSCSLLAKEFGETADECGEAYMVYGKALLELARIENGIVGKALEGIDFEELGEVENEDDEPSLEIIADEDFNQTEEEIARLREQVYDAMSEGKPPSEAGEDVSSEDEKSDVMDMQIQQNDSDDKRVSDDDKNTNVGEEQTDEDAGNVEEPLSCSIGGGVEEPLVSENIRETDCSLALQEPAGLIDDNGKDPRKNCLLLEESDSGSEIIKEHGTFQETSVEDSKPTMHSNMDESNDPKEESEQNDKTETTGDHETKSDLQDTQDEDTLEDVSNMQLSWEMLDLARVICTRQNHRTSQLHAAEALLKLGELGMEKDNYQQAIGDFLQCLAIQQKHLNPDSRLLAETFYQLGIAYTLAKNYSEAAKHFSSSLRCINKRLAVLSESVEKMETAKGTPEVEFTLTKDKEIESLKDLLPEIQAKIIDCEELQNHPEDSSVLKDAMGNATEVPKIRLVEVKDISHLVKKKRKLESDAEMTSDIKKPKQTMAEDGKNGH